MKQRHSCAFLLIDGSPAEVPLEPKCREISGFFQLALFCKEMGVGFANSQKRER